MNLIMGVVFVLVMLLAQGAAYANGGGRHGSGDGGGRHSRHDYYRYPRYYPKSYYYYKKVYFYPSKRYYYYYDVYPAKVNYYGTEKSYGAVNPNYLPIVSIANMASQGLPDSVVISEIERTGSKYKLDTDTINYLKQNDVSDVVIDYMLKTY